MKKEPLTYILVFLLIVPQLSVLFPKVQASTDPSIVEVGISYEDWNVYGTPPLTMTPGGHIRLWYVTRNPNSVPITVILNATIQTGGSTYDDPSNDKTVIIPAGDYSSSRPFYVRLEVPTGSYSIIYAIWASDWSKQYSSMSKPDWLNMVSSVPVDLSSSPSNVGTISWDGSPYTLPTTIQTTTKQHIAICNPPSGYAFNTWQSTGSVIFDPEDQQTVNVWVDGSSGTLTAVLNSPSVPDFTLSINPIPLTINQGDSATATVNLQQMNGYNYAVSLTAYNQPSGVTITFNPTEITSTISSIMNIQVDYTVPANIYTIIIRGTGSDPSQTTHEITFSLTVGNVPFTSDPRLGVSPPASYGAQVLGTAISISFYKIVPAGSHDDYRSALYQHFGISLTGDFQTEAMFLIEVYGLYNLASYLSQQSWSSWAITSDLAAFVGNQQEADGAIRIGVVWRDSIDFQQLMTSVACTVKQLTKLLDEGLSVGRLVTILQELSDVFASVPIEVGVYRVLLHSPQNTHSMLDLSTVAIAEWASQASEFLGQAGVCVEEIDIALDLATLLTSTVDPAALPGWVLGHVVSLIDTVVSYYSQYIPEVFVNEVHIIATWVDPVNVTADTQILSDNSDVVLGWNSTDNSFTDYSTAGFVMRDDQTQVVFLRKSGSATVAVDCHGNASDSIPYTLSIVDTYGNQSYVSTGQLAANQSVSVGMTFVGNVTILDNYLRVSTSVSNPTPLRGQSVTVNIAVNDAQGPRNDTTVSLSVNNSTWLNAVNQGNGQYSITMETSGLSGLVVLAVYATYPLNMTTGFDATTIDILIAPIIQIKPDGSIDPSDAPIQRSGDLYTFTGNITTNSDGIQIERDNMILDGEGYTLEGIGTPEMGIDLSGTTNVTIKNTKIEAFSYGIWLWASIGESIVENDITNNSVGFWLFATSSSTISENDIRNNGFGLYVISSVSSSIIGNNITANNVPGIELDESSSNIIVGNSITNTSQGIILMSQDSSNSIIGNCITNSGIYIVAMSSSNCITRNNITNSYDCGARALAVGGWNNSISENNITNSTGIEIEGSSNSVVGNCIANSNYDGIKLDLFTINNSISENNITNSNYNGIEIEGSSNSVVGNCIANSNYDGIELFSVCSSNSIIGNCITNSNYNGIFLDLWGSSTNNSIITDNITNSNNDGILFFGSPGSNISENDITDCNNYGLVLASSSNSTILGNTFTHCGLFVELSYQISVENNTVNGKQLVYLEGVANYSVGDAGQVILVGCDNIRVENLNLSRASIGVQLIETNNSIISCNNITDNTYGIFLESSSGNDIYHNNFNNPCQVSYQSTNLWSCGYPSGGNYWSDYNGNDVFNGPYQNQTGSDGIGDTPYTIDANNVDNYPLMRPYPSHDVSVNTFTAAPTEVCQGYGCAIEVSVANAGDFAEAFNVTVYANNTATGNVTVINTFENVTLDSRDSTMLAFMWDTTGFDLGNYTISAYATPVVGEINVADNTFVAGTVQIIQGMTGGGGGKMPYMN